MSGRLSKWTRRSFNRGVLLGGVSAFVAAACVHRVTSPAPATTPPWAEGLGGRLQAGRLQLTYRLTQAVAGTLKLPPAQGTVVVAIHSHTQEPRCRPLSAARSLEWKGPMAIDGGWQWEATVDPRELLNLGEVSGLWFLHASMRQFRSEVLALELVG